MQRRRSFDRCSRRTRRWPLARRPLGVAAVVVAITLSGAFVTAKTFAQIADNPELSLELIDPKVFRVCADPRNMPFSTESREGFENKIADLFAAKLRKSSHTWYPRGDRLRAQYARRLQVRCHHGDAARRRLVQVTNPYYRTAYALVFKPGNGLDGVETLADPRLKGKRLGIVAGTPPANYLSVNGLMASAKPYPLMIDTASIRPRRR